MTIPSTDPDDVGWITAADMVEVDRVMTEDLHIGLIQMMENAGRAMAQLVVRLHHPVSAMVLAGSGGNGGGGLVAARHLHNQGVEVTVILSREPGSLASVPVHQLDILQRMGVRVADAPDRQVDVVIDAIIGYSLRGAPDGRAAELIRVAGTLGGPVVSLDTPSGLDVTTGATPGDVVHAAATLTLAQPKRGLRDSPHVGRLYLADISVPPQVLERLGLGPAPAFGGHGILAVGS